jgi:hypothetical protein
LFLDTNLALIALLEAIPKTLNQKELTRKFNADVSAQVLKDNLSQLSKYKNRVFSTQTGVESAMWLHQQASKLFGLATNAQQSGSCDLFRHESYDQPSVICRIPGVSSNEKEKNQLVIFGSHLDSIDLNQKKIESMDKKTKEGVKNIFEGKSGFKDPEVISLSIKCLM